jgi:hypothetical protein
MVVAELPWVGSYMWAVGRKASACGAELCSYNIVNRAVSLKKSP